MQAERRADTLLYSMELCLGEHFFLLWSIFRWHFIKQCFASWFIYTYLFNFSYKTGNRHIFSRKRKKQTLLDFCVSQWQGHPWILAVKMELSGAQGLLDRSGQNSQTTWRLIVEEETKKSPRDRENLPVPAENSISEAPVISPCLIY